LQLYSCYLLVQPSNITGPSCFGARDQVGVFFLVPWKLSMLANYARSTELLITYTIVPMDRRTSPELSMQDPTSFDALRKYYHGNHQHTSDSACSAFTFLTC
jgi:hypothetical protein